MPKYFSRIIASIILLLLILSAGCHGKVSPELLLYGFESDKDLDSIDWKCHTLFTLSEEQRTEGRYSLRMELYPSENPGLSVRLKEKDWSRYQTLSFDIYNPENRSMILSVRIDDRPDNPAYGDRFNSRYTLTSGLNQISIPLTTLFTSHTDRRINLRSIRRMSFVITKPEIITVLFIDNIKLA